MEQKHLFKLADNQKFVSISAPIKNNKAILRIGEFDFTLPEGRFPFVDESKKYDGYVLLHLELQDDGSYSYFWDGDYIDLANEVHV